ncbi:MAG TPA: regulatory protein RecX [Gammaproteobacteria bacterium]|jgi:regulatory protein|nr:regulatory protein RecX [Gammaproteobacteria bacterium]
MTQRQTTINTTALRILARRDHAEAELAQKLSRRGFADDAIRALLRQLTQQDLLNDQRFAESYLRARRNKGYGPNRITLELQARGITAEMIAEIVEITDNAWLIEIDKVWRKRFKSELPQNQQQRAKQARFLQYRGFTLEQIRHFYDKTKHHTQH